MENENSQINYNNNFKLIQFRINGKDIPKESFEIEDIPKQTYQNYYDYKIKSNINLEKIKVNVVEIIYEYNVPIFDITQSYKITLPCKKLDHEFRINEDCGTREKWTLSASAFTTFFCNQKEYDSKYKVEQSTDDRVKIIFNDWALPGAGYVVTLNKMKKQVYILKKGYIIIGKQGGINYEKL